jgi:glycosyltransferase involved in cell wall biosynthesis
MHKLPPGTRATIVPGKTYEYLASGRPILAAVPEGDARDLVAASGRGLVCDPDDVDGIALIIREQLDAPPRATEVALDAQDFEYRRLARNVAAVLDQVTGGQRR